LKAFFFRLPSCPSTGLLFPCRLRPCPRKPFWASPFRSFLLLAPVKIFPTPDSLLFPRSPPSFFPLSHLEKFLFSARKPGYLSQQMPWHLPFSPLPLQSLSFTLAAPVLPVAGSLVRCSLSSLPLQKAFFFPAIKGASFIPYQVAFCALFVFPPPAPQTKTFFFLALSLKKPVLLAFFFFAPISPLFEGNELPFSGTSAPVLWACCSSWMESFSFLGDPGVA